METLISLVLVVHLIVALALIGLVLLQHGKGADMGAAFGSGASGSLFGASGSANFLSRTTGVLAAVFFVSSLALAYMMAAQPRATGSVMEKSVESPAVPVPEKSPEGVAAPAPSESRAKDIPTR
jgi:preprotein translocase subunit SecG